MGHNNEGGERERVHLKGTADAECGAVPASVSLCYIC